MTPPTEPSKVSTPGDGCTPEVRIHKFDDRDRDGQRDPGERMLEGIAFDLIELIPGQEPRVHQRTTDEDGMIVLELQQPTDVRVRELLRQAGGSWGITSEHVRGEDGFWYITEPEAPTRTVLRADCDDIDLWVGNAPPFLPPTGAAFPLTRSQQVDLSLAYD